ncbi:ABC transporter substrate-binding protein [Clostridium algidicarnis]|uniref:ABC transporter substrate-binding protein n=1 Tax=Clostridium algidicarnis TaxID=37659 RepID=UPI001C0CFA7A|nr:iron-siderophore ABC transporter substrate-binding protein [Clostridium algidicarnis]MBU3204365.1 iron-siderophore ABC transporter substrate-binding protein [Clostridium algidicarnis]MBU3212551.1 iron-siderophore ABC transporter substrate-binding protein [Clostridium algidicarnis]MBU3222982.1 iron-siderophore ABC transporter substrate-binding protein [Clostridium algidicarnis]
MTKKALSLILAGIISASLFAGCSNKTKDTSVDKTISIEDAMGTASVPENPKRVVILTNEGTEALLTLGVKPVGAVTGFAGEWYEHTKDELVDTRPVGKETSVNVEAVAALKPDLIIGNKMRHEKIYDQLKSIAPTVYSDTLRGEWKDNFRFYAKVVGKEAEGDKAIKDYEDKVTSIKENYKDKLDTEVSIVRFMAGKTRIYLGDTFSGTIFKEIGFKRPETQQGTDFVNEIGKERLKEADGDVIFYFTYELGDGKGLAREEEWIQDPLFKSLEAVKNNKAFKVDDTIWNTAGGIKAANLMLEDLTNLLKDNKI